MLSEFFMIRLGPRLHPHACNAVEQRGERAASDLERPGPQAALREEVHVACREAAQTEALRQKLQRSTLEKSDMLAGIQAVVPPGLRGRRRPGVGFGSEDERAGVRAAERLSDKGYRVRDVL